MKTKFFIGGLSLIIGTVGLVVAGPAAPKGGMMGGQAPAVKPTQPVMETPEVGKPAKDFALKRYDTGEIVKLSDFKGKKAVMLNFFATWCGPCRSETPGFVKVYEEYKDLGVEFISVDTGERGKDPAAVLPPFVKKFGVTWPIVLDENFATGAAYGAQGIPTNLVISKEGIVKFYRVGGIPERALKQELDRVLGKVEKKADEFPDDPE